MWSQDVDSARRPRSKRVWLGLTFALALSLALSCAEDECDPSTGPGCEPSSTTTAISADDPDPSVIGQVIRVGFEVTSEGGTPAGRVEVTVDDGGVERCSASVELGGCDLKLSSPGSKELRARYLGGSGFTASAATEPHRVDKATTTTTMGSHGPDPSVVGQEIAVSVSVAVAPPGSGTPRGGVTISDGTHSCTADVAQGGCALRPTTVGAKPLTATFSGDEYFESSSDTDSHEVVPASTTTQITSHDPDPSLVGRGLVVGFAVTVAAPGSGVPTGNVTVSDGTDSCAASVTQGGCVLVPTTAGTKTLTATYEGDANFEGSSSSEPHQVATAPASITMTDSPDPSVVGQAVSVGFEVTSPGGTPTGTVTVTVDDDSGDACSAGVADGGCDIVLTLAGAKTLTATYSGDANFVGGAAAEPHQVDRAQTTTVITSDDPDPSGVGEAVAVGFGVTANAPGSGTPTGNVTVSDGTASCTGTVAEGGCTLVLTTAGTKTLAATYEGDAGFEGSTGTASHEVAAAQTTVTLSDEPDPSVVGEAVRVTYEVTSPIGQPTGTVTVTVDDGSGDACAALVMDGGCDLVLTRAGAKTLTATYAGDANFEGSSASEPHQVVSASSTVTVIDEPDPSVVGQQVRVRFEVTSAGGTPTGAVTVTVSDASGATCAASVAVGECDIVLTSAGAKMLTASYSGDGDFQPGSGQAQHQVDPARTTTAITSDAPDPSAVGETIPVTYSVTVNAPGAGTPGGSVTVTDGTDACVGSVAQAACALTLTTAGAKTLTATYAGDADFQSSFGTEPHQVTGAPTTLTMSDVPDPSVVGQSVTVSFQVTASAGGTPTGNVTVTVDDGSGATCSAPVVVGQCTIVLTRPGVKTLTATYSGDASFLGSTAGEPHRVNRAQTATLVTSDAPDPSVTGEPVTVQFAVVAIAPGNGTPTGSVTLTDGVSSCVGTVALGECTLAPTTAGAKSLIATYEGDVNFEGSSDAEPHQVDRAQTTTTILSDAPDPSLVGQAITVRFSVTAHAPGDGTPTGIVTVTDGTVSCTTTVALGACTLTPITPGFKTLRATYAGDADFEGSVGTTRHFVFGN